MERVSIALRITSGLVAGKFDGLIADIPAGVKPKLQFRSVVDLRAVDEFVQLLRTQQI